MPTAIPAAITAVTSTLTTLGFSAAGAAFTAKVIVALAVSGLSKFASSAISGILDDQFKSPILGSAGNRVTIRQPTPKQQIIYGEAFLAGAMFFIEKDPPYLVIGYLLANHECEGLVSVYVNGIETFIDDDGYATSTPFFDGSTQFLRVSFRSGTADQAIDPLIAARFGSVPSTFRQRGHCTAVVEYNYGADDDEHREIWGETGRLQPIFRVRGKKVYDPRKQGHSVDDESTWEWNDSPTLCVMDYLRHPYGGRVSSSEIDWDQIKEAVRIDRQSVARKDGESERRYTCNGIVRLDSTPFDAIRAMMTANFGTLTWEGGKYGYIAAGYREPVGTISESMLAGPVDIQSNRPRGDLVNKIRTEFVAPERDYQLANGPIYKNDAYISADGQVLEDTLKLSFTEGAPRVQRMGKIFMERTRLGKVLRFPVNIEGVQYTAGDVVRVYFENLTQANGIYEIDGISIDLISMTFEYQMTEHSAAPYAWDASTEEQDFEIEEIDTSA